MELRIDASDFSLAVEGKLTKWRDGLALSVLKARRGALEELQTFAKRTLRADLRAAGLGALEKSWRADLYPRKGLAKSPVLYIYSKAEVIVAAFNEGPTIRPTGDGMLAIPIPGSYAEDFPNPKGPETKVDYARRKFGDERLFVIPATGTRPAILAVKMVGTTKTGRLTPRKTTKTGKYRSGTQTAFLFFLVPQVRLPRLLDIQKRFREIERKYPDAFARHLEQELADAGFR